MLLIASCKKEDNADPLVTSISSFIQFPADALAYIQLPVNKYFIYKDSASGALDSVVITQSNIEKKLMPAHVGTGTLDPNIPAFNYESFTLLLSKFTGTSPQDWFYGIAVSYKTLSVPVNPVNFGELNFLERDRIKNADNGYVFIYPFTRSVPAKVSEITSLIIEGKTYNDVASFVYSNSLDPSWSNYRKSTYYWVKGIGIIKREIQTFNSIKTETLVRNG